jgi:hypothetical protein
MVADLMLFQILLPLEGLLPLTLLLDFFSMPPFSTHNKALFSSSMANHHFPLPHPHPPCSINIGIFQPPALVLTRMTQLYVTIQSIIETMETI